MEQLDNNIVGNLSNFLVLFAAHFQNRKINLYADMIICTYTKKNLHCSNFLKLGMQG